MTPQRLAEIKFHARSIEEHETPETWHNNVILELLAELDKMTADLELAREKAVGYRDVAVLSGEFDDGEDEFRLPWETP